MYHHQIRILYKGILRLHRSLPQDLKELGDVYVRDEFRRHLESATENQTKLFLSEWADYYSVLAKQVGVTVAENQAKTFGKALPETKLEDFQDKQLYQLYELKLASQPRFDDQDDDSAANK